MNHRIDSRNLLVFNSKGSDTTMALFSLLTLYSTVTTLITSLLLTTIGYFLFNEWARYRSRVKGLSGPAGLPIIGNLHQVSPHPAITLPHYHSNINQISNKPASEQYRLWSQTYGPVFQIQLGNTPVVIVNSTQAAKSIFLSQGSAINSRPVLAFFHQKASSAALSIGMSPWDESCKKKRKVAATSLNRSRTVGYHPVRDPFEGNVDIELM